MSKQVSVRIDAQRLIDAFLDGRNANTLRSYAADLADFQSFLGTPDINATVAKLLHAGQGQANFLVLEYKNSLKKRGLQSATINRRLSSIRAVIRMARMLGMVPFNLEIPNEKHEPYRDVSGVGVMGIEKILTELRRRRRPQDIRNVAIIRLFYDLGLRREELVQLDLEHLDLDKGEVSILGKGRTQREKLSLPEPTVLALRDWLAVRDSQSKALFTNFDRARKGDGRITGSGIYKLVRWLGRKVNLKTRPHGIRHDSLSSAVRVAADNNILLTDVLRYSRHKNIEVLIRYVDEIENRQGQIAGLVAGTINPNKT